jgi:hypothetical protein
MNKEERVDKARKQLNELLNYLNSCPFDSNDEFMMLDEMYSILIKAKNNKLRGSW